jgi:hypothetical protein
MGVPGRNVRHLHLALYNSQTEGFTPDIHGDVQPILEQLRQIRPDIISVVMDSGSLRPDTHYKVLRSVAAAIRLRSEESDMSNVRILAYRNVWSTFHPAEANMYVPVSLNAFAVIEKAFATSYLSSTRPNFPTRTSTALSASWLRASGLHSFVTSSSCWARTSSIRTAAPSSAPPTACSSSTTTVSMSFWKSSKEIM